MKGSQRNWYNGRCRRHLIISIPMGAGGSTEGAHLTRVTSKNNLGVLFDREAEEAFHAAATGPEDELAVPWSVADAYVKTRDERWRDPKHVLFRI